MHKFKLSGGEIITPDRNPGIGTVLVEDGRIVGVKTGLVESEDYRTVDVSGMYVMPGFIDIHTHGTGNAELFRFLSVYDNVKDQQAGAAFGGLHLESPYFSCEFLGAQDPKHLKNPDPADYMPVLEASGDIKRWSIAPELPEALEFGELLCRKGILPSIAHTSAIYEDVVKAYEAGFSLITHFYSCMNGVVRRNAFRYAGCIEAGFHARCRHAGQKLLRGKHRHCGPAGPDDALHCRAAACRLRENGDGKSGPDHGRRRPQRADPEGL